MKRSLVTEIFAALLAMILLAALPLSVSASADYSGAYFAVLDELGKSSPAYGSVGGEWCVFTLARAGRVTPGSSFASAYYTVIENKLREIGSPVLDSHKATENSRVVIALSSIGRDARSVSNFDLTEPIKDFDFVKKQGPTGVAFALLALDSRSEYGAGSVKNEYVDWLLSKENNGAWSLGTAADPDVTAIVITALAPYQRAASAIQRGISRLSEMQNDRGGFETMGTFNAESCAQVLVALSTVGVDADSDPRFIKNGCSLLDALLSFFRGSGFAHTENGSVNRMATEQAAYSLCAYDRLRNGRNPLYNMNDVSAGATPKPTQTPKPTPTPTPKPTATPCLTPSPTPTAAPTFTPKPTGTPSAAPTYTAEPKHTEAPPEVTETPEAAETPAATDEPASSDEPAPTDEPAQTEEVLPVTDESEAPADTEPATEASGTAENVTETPEAAPEPDAPSSGNSFPWGIAAAAAAAASAGAAVFVLTGRKKKGI